MGFFCFSWIYTCWRFQNHFLPPHKWWANFFMGIPFLGTQNFENFYNFSNVGLSYITLFVFPTWFQIWNSKWPNIYIGQVTWQKYSVIFYTSVLNVCCHIDNVTKHCAVFYFIYDWCLIIEFVASVRQVAKTAMLNYFKIMSSNLLWRDGH